MGAAGPARLYNWSSDNSEELGRGWIRRGDTVKELALTLGIEAEMLVKTVNNYNLCCEQGVDPQCHRESDTLIPLATPPYYAVELWPGGPNTQGGPRRNSKAEVLRVGDSAIPRLYSAGELGAIYGMLYPGAGNIAECVAFRVKSEITDIVEPEKTGNRMARRIPLKPEAVIIKVQREKVGPDGQQNQYLQQELA